MDSYEGLDIPHKEYTEKDVPRYMANSKLKAKNTKMQMTEAQAVEFARCAEDPIYFVRRWTKIVSLDGGLVRFDLWKFQEELLRTIHDNRFTIAKLPRQVGKSTTTVAYLLWYILFHSQKSVGILANKGENAQRIMKRLQIAYENCPFWMQQGVVEWNKRSIELENGSTVIAASTASDAGRSGSFNVIMLDEFAFVPSAVAHEFFRSVFPTISSSKESKVIMVSTPSGMNMFWKKWEDACSGKSNFVPVECHWSDVPGRDEKWKEEQIAELGLEGFLQEHGCEFLGSTDTLISATALKEIVQKDPLNAKMDEFVEMAIYEEPKEGHIYFLTVDTARGIGGDFSAFSVIDTTELPYKQVARYKSSTIEPMLYPSVIHAAAVKYNEAFVLVESNDVGGLVASILYQDLEYENVLQTVSKGRGGQKISGGHGKSAKLGVTTTYPMKSVGCSTLKTLIEHKKLLIHDFETYSELTTFVERGKSYAAEDGANDDLAMSLVIFSWLSTQQYFKDLCKEDFRRKLLEERKSQLESEELPLIEIHDGTQEGEAFYADGDLWFPFNGKD